MDYAPLFSIDIRHDFFDSGRCAALDLRLHESSEELIQRAGLIVKSQPGFTVVAYDRDQIETLRMFAADLDEPLVLAFRAVSVDPLFSDYTDPAAFQAAAILSFDSRGARRDPTDGALRLSQDDYVSASDFAGLAGEAVRSLLSGRDQHVRPIAFVCIHLADEAGNLLGVSEEDGGREYSLSFRARETYWRYLLMGGLARESMAILDSDRLTEFELVGETSVPGDRTAVTFRSKTRIPLRERSQQRFQLRENGANGSNNGRVLIKRLPVASVQGIYRDSVEGGDAFVSDIFLNG